MAPRVSILHAIMCIALALLLALFDRHVREIFKELIKKGREF